MKKKIVSLALLAVSMIGLPMMAQTPSGNSQNKNVENCCKANKGERKAKKDGAKMVKGEARQYNPFEGLTLNDTQKNQLQQLQEKRKAMKEAKKADKQLEKADKRAEKQFNDSVRRAERQASAREYLQEVKEIIGPDQYVIFLENMYVNAPQQGMKAFRQGGRDMEKVQQLKDGKQMKAGKQKGDKKKGGKDKAQMKKFIQQQTGDFTTIQK